MTSPSHAFSLKPAMQAAAIAAEAVAKMWKMGREDAAVALHEAFASADPGQDLSARPMALLAFIEEGQDGFARISGEEDFDEGIIDWIAGEMEKSQKAIDAAWADWLALPDRTQESSEQRHEAQRALDDCAQALCQEVSRGWHKALLLWAERHPERRAKVGENARESVLDRHVLSAGIAPLMLTPASAEAAANGHSSPAGREAQVSEIVESLGSLASRSPHALAALVRHAGDLRRAGEFEPDSAVFLAQEALCAWAADQNRMPWKRRKGEREARSDADGVFFEALAQFTSEDRASFWSADFWSQKPADEKRPAAVRDTTEPSPFATRWEMLRSASWQEPMGLSPDDDTAWTKWWLALSQEAKAPGHPLAQAEFSLGAAARKELFKSPFGVDQTVLRALKENLLDLDWAASGQSLGQWLADCQSGARHNSERGGDWAGAFAAVARQARFAPDGCLWEAHDSAANAAANAEWMKAERGSSALLPNALMLKECAASIAVNGALVALFSGGDEKAAAMQVELAVEGFAALERAGLQSHAPRHESLSVESAWKAGRQKKPLAERQRPRADALSAAIEAWALGRVAREARSEASDHAAPGEEALGGAPRKLGAQRL